MLGRVKLASSKKQGKRPVRTCRLFSGRPASCMRRCRGSKLNSVSFTSNTTARGLAGIVVIYTLDEWEVGGCASLLAFWLEMLCSRWARCTANRQCKSVMIQAQLHGPCGVVKAAQ